MLAALATRVVAITGLKLEPCNPSPQNLNVAARY
jgi:hypothetical protein